MLRILMLVMLITMSLTSVAAQVSAAPARTPATPPPLVTPLGDTPAPLKIDDIYADTSALYSGVATQKHDKTKLDKDEEACIDQWATYYTGLVGVADPSTAPVSPPSDDSVCTDAFIASNKGPNGAFSLADVSQLTNSLQQLSGLGQAGAIASGAFAAAFIVGAIVSANKASAQRHAKDVQDSVFNALLDAKYSKLVRQRTLALDPAALAAIIAGGSLKMLPESATAATDGVFLSANAKKPVPFTWVGDEIAARTTAIRSDPSMSQTACSTISPTSKDQAVCQIAAVQKAVEKPYAGFTGLHVSGNDPDAARSLQIAGHEQLALLYGRAGAAASDDVQRLLMFGSATEAAESLNIALVQTTGQHAPDYALFLFRSFSPVLAYAIDASHGYPKAAIQGLRGVIDSACQRIRGTSGAADIDLCKSSSDSSHAIAIGDVALALESVAKGQALPATSAVAPGYARFVIAVPAYAGDKVDTAAGTAEQQETMRTTITDFTEKARVALGASVVFGEMPANVRTLPSQSEAAALARENNAVATLYLAFRSECHGPCTLTEELTITDRYGVLWASEKKAKTDSGVTAGSYGDLNDQLLTLAAADLTRAGKDHSVLDNLEAYGVALGDTERSAFFHIQLNQGTAKVDSIVPYGSAAAAGLVVGDEVVAINDAPMSSLSQDKIDALLATGSDIKLQVKNSKGELAQNLVHAQSVAEYIKRRTPMVVP
jgi:hypothetical protein